MLGSVKTRQILSVCDLTSCVLGDICHALHSLRMPIWCLMFALLR